MSIGQLPVFRFAPSPNGLLHLGHAYSAIMASSIAKRCGGTFHLRIEDIDSTRADAAYVAAIERDLHWLGLKWELPITYQSDHFDVYRKAIQQLNTAELLYPCFASRSEIQQAYKNLGLKSTDPDGAPIYPGVYKNYSPIEANSRIKDGEPYALRLDMDKAIKLANALNKQNTDPLSYKSFNDQGEVCGSTIVKAEQWGDVVIVRKDIPTSYHLSVVLDDHNQGVTHICRGKDLEAATDVHRILQTILKLNEPLYHHHELVMRQGEKLSKSKAHPSLYELRTEGIRPEDICKAAISGPETLRKFLP